MPLYNVLHFFARRGNQTRNPLPGNLCPQNHTKHAFTSKFYLFLGPLLYNRLNAKANIYCLNNVNCKRILNETLQKMSYDDTEKLLLVLK
ncbi:hypothetical protein SFRURICE_013378 [Spodoptera frugiperda]|nr:hypothetical protein SFRURICE_013378 [Spodoptera frugiperda]